MFQTATAVCMFEQAWHPIACLLMQAEDLRRLAEAGCAAVFMPATLYHAGSSSSGGGGGGSSSSGGGGDAGMVVGASEEVDPEAHETWISLEHLSQGLCAKTRPHFFRGVCTVGGLAGLSGQAGRQLPLPLPQPPLATLCGCHMH